MHLHFVHLAIMWSVSAEPLALVHLGGGRKLSWPLKSYSTTQVMLNTLVFWVRGATQVVFAACVRKLSPFPGYFVWKDYVLRTMFHILQDIFSDYICHICTRPTVWVITVQMVWLFCTVTIFILIYYFYKSVMMPLHCSLFHFPI